MVPAVRMLAEKIKETERQVDIQRALIATRAHQATEGEPTVIRRAKVLAAVLSEMDIRIEEREFIVGNQGRWAYRSHTFAYGAKVMPPSMRLKNQRAVAVCLDEGAGYRSDQGMIWRDLALKADRMDVHSETGAMADLFEGQRDHLGEYLKAFRLVECQIGAAFANN